NGCPKMRLTLRTFTEDFKLVMLMQLYCIFCSACYDMNKMFGGKLFLYSFHCFKHGADFFLSVKFLLRMQAVVATAAIFLIIFFTKIIQQHLAAAGRSFGIAYGLNN